MRRSPVDSLAGEAEKSLSLFLKDGSLAQDGCAGFQLKEGASGAVTLIQQLSGLARTARGPSMSCHPGKVEIQGVAEINGEKTIVLRMIQGRNPDWVQWPFFAKYDEGATWLDHLQPAFGEANFFFEN
jgi:hypothetical protein